jgi:hypothetical protein
MTGKEKRWVDEAWRSMGVNGMCSIVKRNVSQAHDE